MLTSCVLTAPAAVCPPALSRGSCAAINVQLASHCLSMLALKGCLSARLQVSIQTERFCQNTAPLGMHYSSATERPSSSPHQAVQRKSYSAEHIRQTGCPGRGLACEMACRRLQPRRRRGRGKTGRWQHGMPSLVCAWEWATARTWSERGRSMCCATSTAVCR